MGYENLVGVYDPYIHSRSATFNMAARTIDVGEFHSVNGQRKIEESLQYLKNKRRDCISKEETFYKAYGVKNAKEWGAKYLAKIGKGATIPQIALAVWNSHGMLQALKGYLIPPDEVRKIISSSTFSKDYKKQFIDMFVVEAKENSEVFARKLAEYIESSDFNTQTVIRRALGAAGTLKFLKGGKIENLTRRIAYENVREFLGIKDINKKVRYATNYFKNRLRAEIINNLDRDFERKPHLKKQYDDIVNFFSDKLELALHEESDWLYRGLLSSHANILGSLEEIGDAAMISYQLSLNLNLDSTNFEKMFQNVGQTGIPRFGRDEKEGKTDVIMEAQGQGYRFQMKNTDKDIFSNLEAQTKTLSTDPFFNIHSKIKYVTFLEDIQKIKDLTIDTDLLSSLSYLLANINVLNKSTPLDNQNKNKAYKQWTKGGSAPGQMISYAETIVSRIISLYIIFALADFSKEVAPGIYQDLAYDFIIFDSRVLIPVSVIYDGLIKNIEQTSAKIVEKSAHLTVKSSITQTFNMNALHQTKSNAVGGLDPTLDPWYQDEELVAVGKVAGREAVQNLVLSGMQLDVNVENLVNVTMIKK